MGRPPIDPLTTLGELKRVTEEIEIQQRLEYAVAMKRIGKCRCGRYLAKEVEVCPICYGQYTSNVPKLGNSYRPRSSRAKSGEGTGHHKKGEY
jgi:hypothetical protein